MFRDFSNSIVRHLDDVFAYDTVKLIRVLDRRLGFLFYFVNLLVIVYVIVYVFLIKEKYLETEKTSGWAFCKVMKPQLSAIGIEWDVYDRVTNPGEQGAVFIPTRVLITRGQTQGGFCESPVHNCSRPLDCDIGNAEIQKKECSPSGRCMRRQWCPAEDEKDRTITEMHELGIEDVELWFSTYVHYHTFGLDVSTTDESSPRHYPHPRANTFRLLDIVRMANLDPLDFQENGAVLLINTIFTCNLDAHNCEFKIESQNIDTKTGYNHVHNHIYWEDGVRKRDTYRMYGIRLVILTTGIGFKTSFVQIMLQLSSAISLLSVAETVADFYLMYMVPERKHYVEHKIIETEDFND
mmetsp:Transcript_65755/g.183142  ORF Transcript_65755/g.183142 Transcript_65755/m.183142 type:complete len:352 (+) Transcript_65755:91-1146(+)|eukprot:CAMPEP_0117596082 /NCGR_PEP_ID=MMETSP0784-20121206/74111_1 /TAXON_ID=39447 /ORGANISM="" /LENGTH=351 /DNA_ID=CAMNT_0005398317 /DNA_START=91 /DNA_END=1146 /DNA_ORIENTATION=-